MFHEIVERALADGKTLLDGIAWGSSHPGPIVITATFVGYLLQGVSGATAATICVFLPSFLIVVVLSPALTATAKRGFDCFMNGILCSFCGLLVSTVYHFSRIVEWSWAWGSIAAAAFAALYVRAAGSAVLLGA